jgi:hypothetical protein
MRETSGAQKFLHWRPGQRRRILVRTPYASFFASTKYNDYDGFVNAEGEPLKSEPRTSVVLLRQKSNSGAGQPARFVLKVYRYPLLPRIRTGFQISKAEREFNSLLFIKQLGVQAAEPVAFGVERTRLGFVRSCFVITAFEEDTVNLSQWKFANGSRNARDNNQERYLLKQIGKMFQRIHRERFFLFTPKTKNLLVRTCPAAAPKVLFVDVPYARTLRYRPFARWAQGRDLGVFLANVSPALTETQTASFYEGYLPDPLGGTAATIRRLVKRAMRSKQNLTPLSALVHQAKRIVRKQIGRFTLYCGLHSLALMELSREFGFIFDLDYIL